MIHGLKQGTHVHVWRFLFCPLTFAFFFIMSISFFVLFHLFECVWQRPWLPRRAVSGRKPDFLIIFLKNINNFLSFYFCFSFFLQNPVCLAQRQQVTSFTCHLSFVFYFYCCRFSTSSSFFFLLLLFFPSSFSVRYFQQPLWHHRHGRFPEGPFLLVSSPPLHCACTGPWLAWSDVHVSHPRPCEAAEKGKQ